MTPDSPHVTTEFIRTSELPAAVFPSAYEGLLPGVGPQVSLEQPRPGEGLAALLALAGQRVGPDVHLQGAGGVVTFATILASGLALDLIRTVKLLVLGEP